MHSTILLKLHRTTLFFCACAALLIVLLYATLGQFKAQVRWLDVISEGSVAVTAALWLVMVLSSRPAGRVTRHLAFGLAGIMLGAVADCSDEFFRIDKAALWNHAIEGGATLVGMLLLTMGLYFWRIEQFQVNADLQKRERLFRNHLGFDAVTQLADAHYLRQQIAIANSSPAFRGALVMLNVNDFHPINRQYGQAEGDRVLLALSHLLLLNLRQEDLLCRYAGDCFVVLMPQVTLAQAHSKAEELCLAVRSLRHHTQHGDGKLTLSMRFAVNRLSGKTAADARASDALLTSLSQQLAAPLHESSLHTSVTQLSAHSA